MLDFTKDTDWYIAPYYFARKFGDTDDMIINSFFNEYHRNYPIDTLGVESDRSVIFSSMGVDGNAQGAMLGLFDKRDSQLAGVISILNTDNERAAELKIYMLGDQLSVAVMINLLIWAIDHVLYCLNFNELYIFLDKRCIKLIRALSDLKFKSFKLLSTLNSDNQEVYLQVYFLNECQWLNDKTSDCISFDRAQADQYIQEIVRPYFQTCIAAPMYAIIVDFRYETVMATNKTANSVGLTHWDETIGTSYKYYSRLDLTTWYFGERYNHKTAASIHHYARKIFRIQQYVFKTGHPASFIDSLPYDKGIRSYLVTYIPVFNSSGNVIAIQSIAFDYRLAGYHEYIQDILEQKKTVRNIFNIKLSKREEEVLFLLTCGITQEKIGEILEIKRDTVATIIKHQLCVKFSLPEVNTKLLIETALSYGFPFSIPESLWCPSVIILEEKLSNWILQYN